MLLAASDLDDDCGAHFLEVARSMYSLGLTTSEDERCVVLSMTLLAKKWLLRTGGCVRRFGFLACRLGAVVTPQTL